MAHTQTFNNMKKILIVLVACLVMAGCKKETPEPDGNAAATYDTVDFHFSPYQMEPMKSNAVGTVCSRLDIYIIDTAAGDTMRWHQVKADDPTGFGTLSVVLQTGSWRWVTTRRTPARIMAALSVLPATR